MGRRASHRTNDASQRALLFATCWLPFGWQPLQSRTICIIARGFFGALRRMIAIAAPCEVALGFRLGQA